VRVLVLDLRQRFIVELESAENAEHERSEWCLLGCDLVSILQLSPVESHDIVDPDHSPLDVDARFDLGCQEAEQLVDETRREMGAEEGHGRHWDAFVNGLGDVALSESECKDQGCQVIL